MTEARARKLFRKARIGKHYVWTNSYGDRVVLRVLQKRLTVGATGFAAEVRGIMWDLRDDGVLTGECHPRGLVRPNWITLAGRGLPVWKGKRPRRTPIYIEYRCANCERRVDPLAIEHDTSPCCLDVVDERRMAGREHDTRCVCDDCEEERR